MKRRLLSLLLTLAMLFTMVPMMGIGVGAESSYSGVYHTEDNPYCDLVRFAYRAALCGSTDYFQAFKFLKLYNYSSANVKQQFEDSPFYVIYDDQYFDPDALEIMSDAVRTALNKAFSSDTIAPLQDADIYDALLLNALLDAAEENANLANGVEVSSNIASWSKTLKNLYEGVVTLDNVVVPFAEFWNQMKNSGQQDLFLKQLSNIDYDQYRSIGLA